MIQVINRAFDILEFLAADPAQPQALGAIADAIGLNHGTCANILKTMVSRHYIDQVGPKKGYRLGLNAYQLTGNPAYFGELLHVARSEMTCLTRSLEESCLLAVLHGHQRVLIHRELCNQALQVQTADEKHVYDSASGRLLVAFLTDAELDKFVVRFGLPSAALWPEASEPTSFRAQIDKIRSAACAHQESVRQIIGYAVPIRQYGNVIASLSVYLPTYRHDAAKAAEVVDSLRQTAQTIDRKLASL